MSMYAKVRRMHFGEKATVSEIARRTSLSRNMIKKWLKEPERSELTYVRPPGKTKLDPYLAELRQALQTGCASSQAGSAHAAEAACRDQGQGLCRRILAADPVHPPMECTGRDGHGAIGVRAVAV